MRWDNLYVAGTGAYLPKAVETAEEAIAAGRYTQDEHLANGIRQVRVARLEDEGPAQMAAAAARQAVERSGHLPEEFGLVVHGNNSHQGQEFWTPASYVQDNSIGGHAATAEVRQGSNGGLVGFELAASWVAARPDTAALVTAGDSFHLPYFDRWNSDDQQVFGDGAGALVLSTRTGFARVLGSTTYADSTLEPIYRGGDWTTGPFAEGRTVSLRSRKRDFLATGDNLYEQTIERMTKSLFAVTGQLFDELGLGIDDMAYLIHANTGQTIVDWGFYHPLGVDVSRTVYEWGRDFGHMGAADHIVNLNHLVETAPLKPGDKVLTIGVGTGFIWTAFVMEILEAPAWGPQA
ncbi:ketoacyl-ACP synthase III family protein [Streptacidiphilus monticola]|uniref:Ketoacyl-ACP synthase III family protein n=1 Tax=Streptacidiphilus monticola TaxID=2161674 RepID=A0ABW1FXA5_9ACTN